MNRAIWIVRILGLLMLLGFMLLFMNLEQRLVRMQGTRPPATTTTR